MATGETGFDDVTFDLISLQYHALKAGHDYGQYVRDAENAGQDEIALLPRGDGRGLGSGRTAATSPAAQLGGTDNTSPSA